MDEKTEAKVLTSLYDRLFQAVTHAPAGKQNDAFTEATTFLQFAQNQAINPKDFANMVTATNPKGNLGANEQFANLVDQMPSLSAAYAPSGTLVSQVYKEIVNGANSATTPDPEQKKKYDKAFAFLNTTIKIKDYDDNEVEQTDSSKIYKDYQRNQTAYIAAVSGYRTAYLNYDLTDVVQQRQWQANEPVLSNAVNQAYDTWRTHGAAQVEQALSVLASSMNDAVSNVIADIKRTLAAPLTSATLGGAAWYFTYPIPSNFADPEASGFATLTLNSDSLSETASAQASAWNVGGSGSSGLWNVGGSAGGSHAETQSHMDADTFSLSAEIAVVRIFRPWLNDLIFKMNAWSMSMVAVNGISTGRLTGDSHLILPLIPMGFVVARKVAIKANWSSEDRKHVEDAVTAKTSVGWGPFSVSGGYSHSSSSDSHASTFDGGTLNIPGIQIIAWINEITPASPPL